MKIKKRLKPFYRCISVFAITIALVSFVIEPPVKTCAVSPSKSSSAGVTEKTNDTVTETASSSMASSPNTNQTASSSSSFSEKVVSESSNNSGEIKSQQEVLPEKSKNSSKISSAPKITVNSIADQLGIVDDFAVFARNFTMACHMEGNIAVNNFTAISGNIGNTSTVFKNLGKFNLNIAIDAGSLNVGRTYTVYIYDNPNRSGTPVFKRELAIKDANGNEHISVTDLDASKIYYVFLLDSHNNVISGPYQGDASEGQAVSSSNDSYLKNVIVFKDDVFQAAENFQQRTVFGSDYRLNSTTDPSKTYQITGDGTYMLIRKNDGKALGKVGGGKNNKVSIATGNFPIDFDGTFTKLNGLSAGLESGDFDSNIKVINAELKNTDSDALCTAILDALHQTDRNFLTKTGIPLEENQYLVVNVDCKGSPTVAIPACKIGGVDYGAWDEKSVIAGRVIWNFFNKDSTGNYTPYKGKVDVASGMLGTILAPEAEVIINSSMSGAVYSHTVTNPGGEIHKMPFWRSKTVNREMNFYIPYSLTVKKIWSDDNDEVHKRPSQVVIDLYHYTSADETSDTPLYTVTIRENADGSWPKYTFTNLPNSGLYKVVERPVDGYISTIKECKNVCGDIITITNTYLPTYTLPCVGGSGTGIFTSIGSGIIILSILLLIILRRRDKVLIT